MHRTAFAVACPVLLEQIVMRLFCISCMGYLCECAVLEVLKGVIGQFCAFGGLSWAALLYRTSCGSKLGTLCISSIVHRVISCDVDVEDFVFAKMACHCSVLQDFQECAHEY